MNDLKNDDTFTRIKEFLTHLKESPALVLILFSILGGTWQLIQLSSISISYIRFFSITQLIPDGLILVIVLILFIVINLGIFLILISLVYLIADIIPKKIKDKIQLYTLNLTPQHWIIRILILFLFVFILGYIIWISGIPSFKIDIVFFLINIVLLMLVLILADVFFEYTTFPLKRFVFLFYVGIGTCALMLFFGMATFFNNRYLYPTNLKNFDVVTEKMESQNPNAKIEILYFNDKYLFINIIKENINLCTNDTIDKIEIINFEDIPTKP